MNKKLNKLSLITFIISVICFVITYFVFHYITDEGFTLIKQDEAGKPLVTYVIAFFSTLMLFLSVSSLLINLIFFKKEKSDKLTDVCKVEK